MVITKKILFSRERLRSNKPRTRYEFDYQMVTNLKLVYNSRNLLKEIHSFTA